MKEEAVEIKVDQIISKYYVNCLEAKCIYRSDCANHCTAGDFRNEDGIRPRLSLRNGKVYCATKNLPYNEDIFSQTIPIEPHDRSAVLGNELIEETNTFDI